MSSFITLAVFLILLAGGISADTPANCTYEDIKGSWTFEVGPSDNEQNCSNFKALYTFKVDLSFPDVATDEFNNEGFWTMIYNQGFEVVVGGRKYFGFSVFTQEETSVCDQVNPGWSHDVHGNDWECFRGQKSVSVIKKAKKDAKKSTLKFETEHLNAETKVAILNKMQKSWTARVYEDFDGLSQEDRVKMAGGKNSRIASRPAAAPLTEEQRNLKSSYPANFDWRNVDGQNFVSPVRDQGSCGSCYSFASLAMAESRVMILTNNTENFTFAPQDIVECSPYSQGCDGGFPYLIGGKYAADFGLVEEKCNPYTGSDGKCSTDKSCARHYVSDYRYVGGYYGSCNEAAMMEAIYNRGPVAVGFEVYGDFMNYQSGVYHHVFNQGLLGKFEPFELTNHAVLVVGWGETTDKPSEKYWIVKNSWGENWGMNGYFWISRGNDECAIESMAVEATPIFRFD